MVKINQVYKATRFEINGSDTFVVTSVGKKIEARPVINDAVVDDPFFISMVEELQNDGSLQYVGMLGDILGKLTPDQIAALDAISFEIDEEWMNEMYEQEIAMELYEAGLEVC